MARFFKPQRRPGFSAYFRPSPHQVEQDRVRRLALEQQSRARITADIERHKIEMQQRELGI